MNRIDSLFVGLSIWIAWVMLIIILPNKILMILVYPFIASLAVGLWINHVILTMMFGSRKKRIADLIELADDLFRLNDKLSTLLAEAIQNAQASQAEVDRLMLEFCPEEMTPEQFERWEDHQLPSNKTTH